MPTLFSPKLFHYVKTNQIIENMNYKISPSLGCSKPFLAHIKSTERQSRQKYVKQLKKYKFCHKF